MTKNLIYVFISFVLSSCGQKHKDLTSKANDTIQNIQQSDLVRTAINNESSNIDTSWLEPPFLAGDFNGDNQIDTAFAIIINNKKGIRIKHGHSDEEFILGSGNEFGNGGDDFNWVEEWNLVTDKTTYEVSFAENGDVDGSREVELKNTSFYIGSEEFGGATVTWSNGKYIWIHQAD